MRYYAIARLENNGNKGFRIYDDISKGCKDVPLENIENLINNEIVNIANLKIHRGKLIGYGGNLEDLGLIVNNVVVKNSYILMAIVEEKYSLIDVNGNITTLESDSVEKLILNNLVFNAKNKYNRQGIKHGITYKEVEFNTIRYINIAERKDTGKYIGDKVEGRILANVLMNSNINKESKIKYSNISLDNNRLKIMTKTDKHYKINNGRLDILEGFIQYEGYTLIGTISRDIDFYKEINFNEVRALIFNSDIIDVMNRCINDYNTRAINNVDKIVDKETGLYKPSVKKYGIMTVMETYRNTKDIMSIDDNTVMDVINKLKVMRARVRVMTKYSENNIALFRICGNKGIEYKVISRNSYYTSIRNISIEKLYEDRHKYANIELINDKEFIIRGFDGNYRYNIDKIYNAYGTGKMESRKEIKAKLIGVELVENINERGELIELRTENENVVIPSNVKVINKDSLVLNKKNKSIEFGDNIKKCNVYMIKNYYGIIDKVKIDCKDKKVIINIMKGLNRAWCITRNTVVSIEKRVDKHIIGEILKKRNRNYKVQLNGNDSKEVLDYILELLSDIKTDVIEDSIKKDVKRVNNKLYSNKITVIYERLRYIRVNSDIIIEGITKDYAKVIGNAIDKIEGQVEKAMKNIEEEMNSKFL